MKTKISFPQIASVPAEVPLYATLPAEWSDERVAELAGRFQVRGSVKDEGTWFVVRDGRSTLEVYQASHSLRLGRDDFDAEGRAEPRGTLDRERALAVANEFHQRLGDTEARAELHSVTELEVVRAIRGNAETESRVVGLQANYRYDLHGLPLIGPGAKAQVTVGRDGELAQAYRFWRSVSERGTRPTVRPEEAFERFAGTSQFASLPESAKVTVTSVELGLLCLPPTEVQGVLLPAYLVRGEVSTKALPSYRFVQYLSAAKLDDVEAKRNRWAQTRPSLLVA